MIEAHHTWADVAYGFFFQTQGTDPPVISVVISCVILVIVYLCLKLALK